MEMPTVTPPLRRNIELKARCSDLDSARARALTLELRGQSRMSQIDSYFQVPHGRLKLREIDGSSAELIWYDRPNHATARDSNYTVVPVSNPQAMLDALARACGLRGQVRKSREVYLHHNVRIHLDQVEGLGTFIEFEAVIDHPSQEKKSRELLDQLKKLLGIHDLDICSKSYSDLLGI